MHWPKEWQPDENLKDNLAKVKDDLRETAAHLQDRETEAATLRADLQRERTALLNRKQRHNTLHKQARKLMEERNALTGLLRQSLLTPADLEARLRTAGIPTSVPAVATEKSYLQALFEKTGTPLVSPEEVPEVPETQEPLRLVQSQREVGGAVDNGDMPRFTLNELRRMLNERNHLKAKVMELQDELAAGKTPRAALDAHLQPWRNENPASGSTAPMQRCRRGGVKRAGVDGGGQCGQPDGRRGACRAASPTTNSPAPQSQQAPPLHHPQPVQRPVRREADGHRERRHLLQTGREQRPFDGLNRWPTARGRQSPLFPDLSPFRFRASSAVLLISFILKMF
ncbi:RILP-like protein 1 [Paramacrobiotus metropolitanus]|uniref:RILP-like protein 1 n=1 Tax=Paramacrobiotus metropolitanus TaxID=2943436 RepID=UPI0024457CEF|nr:RILP-like protein 1 [Paramacrobiotus metropolitanus]